LLKRIAVSVVKTFSGLPSVAPDVITRAFIVAEPRKKVARTAVVT
jgi:hypothetical protein